MNALLKAARTYTARRRWKVVPIPPREKFPRKKGWQKWRLTEDDLPQHFNTVGNIGLLLGTPSGGLVDVDLDVPEALTLASKFLPATDMIHGRASTPAAHRWYVCEDPPPTKPFEGPDGKQLIELRSTGAQTVVPPSVHPDGEVLAWENFGDPAGVDADDLRRRVARLAAAVLLARAWPKRGSRHEAAKALAGTFLRHGWTDVDTAHFIEAVADAAQDEEIFSRIRNVVSTARRQDAGGATTGLPTLARLVGKEVVDRVVQWLDLQHDAFYGSVHEEETTQSSARHESIPDDAYLGVAADFAALYAEYTEAPRPFLYFTFLAYLGTLTAHRVTLNSELRPSPRLYVVCLGPSSETRKSSSLDHVDRFFRQSISCVTDFIHYGLGSAEGLAKKLGRDDHTGAARSMLLHLDELRVLVDKARPEGSIILPMLATLFERTVFDNTTKTHTVTVRDGYLSLVAACTAETYAAIWTPAFLDIGFTNRLWLVTGGSDRRIALPAPIPERLRSALTHDLGTLLERINQVAGTGTLTLRIEDEAARNWQTWYEAMPRTIHSRRLDTYGWRLMILLSLSRGDLESVKSDVVRHVCALLDHQLAMRQEYDPIDAENAIARMEEAVRRKLRARGPLDKRDLRRFVNADRHGLWAFHQALTNLQRAGDVRTDRAGKVFALRQETRPRA